jgi:hypothetical protein
MPKTFGLRPQACGENVAERDDIKRLVRSFAFEAGLPERCQWLPEPDGGDYQAVRTGLAPELLRMTHLGPLPPETIEH